MLFRITFLILTLAVSHFVFAAEWGYDPPNVLPKDWGTLAGFELCGTGKAQSPIDLSQSKLSPLRERARLVHLPNMHFSYHETPLHMLNNGHTIEVEYEAGSTLRLRDRGPRYEIAQFHFHAPSEHSFEEGALFDIEMHIVHKKLEDPSKLAVIGVLIKEGGENSALKPITDHLSSILNEGEEFVDANIHINIEDALPSDRRYFAYRGSLTTPPCSEVVQWRVLRQPIEMTREQIHSFINVLDHSCCPVNGNNRPVQPLNGRVVELDRTLKQ